MNIRHLIAVAAIAVAPLAAHAGPPSGEFFTDFHLDSTAAQPQFPVSEYSNYVEFPVEQLAASVSIRTREEVRAELVSMPTETIGA